MGFERALAVLNGKTSVYDTDIFADVMQHMQQVFSEQYTERSARIIADHVRTGVHLMADGVVPKNVDQGYILRRLLRRAIREAYSMGYEQPILVQVARFYIDTYADVYVSIGERTDIILSELQKEEDRF